MTNTTKPATCCHQARLTALSEARWAALHAGTAADLTGIIDSLIHQTKENKMTKQAFTASNGVTITISDEGYLTATGGSGENSVLHATGGAEYGVQALREFFRHERDEQLGRVRWPENPDYVIYRAEEGDDEDGRCVEVLHEPSAIVEKAWERWDAKPISTGDLAARWYFTEGPGKPERPWEDAVAGEVWRLTVDGEEGTYLAGESVAGTPYFYGQTSSPDADDTGITAGRKLVNADGSIADE